MSLKIATVTDIHHGAPALGHNADQKLTAQGLPLLDAFISRTERAGDIGLIANFGDCIEHNRNNARLDESTFSEVLRRFQESSISSIHAVGNHDLLNISEAAIAKLLGQEKLYHSLNIGDHHVVVLHTHSPNRDGSDISVSHEQLQWLRQDLQKTEKPTVVIAHHPLSDQDLRGNTWFEGHPQYALVQNRDEVRSVLRESGNVVAVLNGHTHWNTLDVHDGIPYVTQQSLIEKVASGFPANAHGLVTLNYGQFAMELMGNNPLLTHQNIATQMASAYDSVADAYRRETAQYGQPEQDEFDKIVAMLPDHASKVVVDYACGPARDAGHFQAHGFKYIGVDVSPEFLSHARRAVPEGEFYQGDFAEIRLAPNSASIAWHSSSLQHAKREVLPQVLKNAFDTLEPGGLFYAHYRSGQGESIQISTEYGRPIARFIALYEEAEMIAALQETGFEIIKSWTFDHQYSGLKGETVKYKSKVIARKPE